jgi:CubicO group peptidase (beta-lactamase class C family)
MINAFLKRSFHILLSVTLCAILAGTVAPVFAQTMPETLEEKVNAYITETMRRLPIPGLAVGIVKGDRVLYVQGYGTANANNDLVTPQTPFMLASVTKTFTALAVQQLAVAGKIDLDQSVQTYIPEFRLANENDAALITVRHLLDHTSGLFTIEGTQPYLQRKNTTFAEALHGLARYRLKHAPGTQYEYSNWNYVLLGEAITRASGESYADFMQKNILDPLEMSHTTFADHHTIPGAATGNLIVFGTSVPYDEPYIPIALSAGYLTSTAEDMTHYLIALFDHGQYHEQTRLSDEGMGWYDTSWYWHVGMPDDIRYSFSGGHNSINTNIQLFPLHRVGVVILMNTRLDSLIPGPTTDEIAFNIARISINYPYQLPSNRRFYSGYALLIGFLLLMSIRIMWQACKLKNWRIHYQIASRPKRIGAWFGIILDFWFCLGILILPNLLGTRWNIVLYYRPDFGIPFLMISFFLGLLGFMKVLGIKA